MGEQQRLDHDEFKAAIFRRGNKQELFHEGDEDASEPTGEEKIEELYALWQVPHTGYARYVVDVTEWMPSLS